MAERLFKYQSVAELQTLAANIGTALTTGNTTSLRHSSTGFQIDTAPVSSAELRRHLMSIRYEIYLRGVDGDDACAALEATNPYLDKVMTATTIYEQ